MNDVREYAKNKWPFILTAIGINPRFLSRRNGPCPICGGKDRFRFTDYNGEGRYYCNQCGPGDGFDLAAKVTGKKFNEIRDYIMKNAVNVKPLTNPINLDECHKEQAKVWGNGKKPKADGLVRRYLIDRLGIYPEKVKNIREYENQMIARVTDVNDMGVNIHRTFLIEKNGLVGKTDKKIMRGEIPKGSAIRLTPVAKTLGIAEGIETALSASLLFRVPVWSVISTVGMINWIPPEDTENIIIYGDNDENYAGQSAAYQLANKLTARYHKRVEVRIPPSVGTDWNDELKRHVHLLARLKWEEENNVPDIYVDRGYYDSLHASGISTLYDIPDVNGPGDR